MSKNDGGPAYPTIGVVDNYPIENTTIYYTGMSLRDAAALAALQGLCANPGLQAAGDQTPKEAVQQMALISLTIADAFIAERERGE